MSINTELRQKNVAPATLVANQIESIPYLCLISILLTFIWFRYFTSSKNARSPFQ